MDTLQSKPLTPLTHGSILIVGAKASNFDDELKTHPRVIVWDSQNEHWTNKSVPDNVRAIFITRFVSHATTEKLIAEARKRQLTLFNVEGTGIIVKQARELLGITKPVVNGESVKDSGQDKGKLKPLLAFVDFSKTNIENARILKVKAVELGITTTEASLANSVATQRRKQSGTAVPRSIQSKVDVSVEILDSAIKELQDVRTFLIETVTENTALRAKLDKFKKVFED